MQDFRATREIETTFPRTGMGVLVKLASGDAVPATINKTDTHRSPPFYVIGPTIGGWVGGQQIILDPFTTDGK